MKEYNYKPITLDNAARIRIRNALLRLSDPPEDRGLDTELYMNVAAQLIEQYLPEDVLRQIALVSDGSQPAVLVNGFPIGGGKNKQAEKIAMAIGGLSKLSLNYHEGATSLHADLEHIPPNDSNLPRFQLDQNIIEKPPLPPGYKSKSDYYKIEKNGPSLLSGVGPHEHMPIILVTKHGNASAFTSVFDADDNIFLRESLKQGSMLFMGNRVKHMRNISIEKKNSMVERDVTTVRLSACKAGLFSDDVQREAFSEYVDQRSQTL